MNFAAVFSTSGRFALSALCAVGLLCNAPAARAASSDENALIEGAKLCTRYLPRHERQYGIPEHLLAAIASTESGRFHRGLGLNLPWPWTINVNGRGYFFDTKEEAVAAVNKLRAEGYQSIDVGCMQVNLHHHPKAFSSVEQAFDPAYNVGYAASFLKNNFMEEGSWRKATGDYHSRTASYGAQYSDQVFGTWGRIVSKVADARAGRPILNDYAKNSSFKAGNKPVVMASRMLHPTYRPPHMRMMSVTAMDHSVTRENGVKVIRPQKNDDIVVQFSQDTQAAATPAAKAGPNVRFSNANANDLQPAKTTSSQSGPAPVKVVSLTGKSQPGGQFNPKAAAASNATLSDTPLPSAKGNKLFVFDN